MQTICVFLDTVLKKKMNIFTLFLFTLFGGFLFNAQAHAAESHPGISLETQYSEAVLAFNKKQTQEALRILDDILKNTPNHIESLELKALTLKTSGKSEQAEQVYEQLLKLKPEKEQAPYHFELAVIYYQKKKNDLAKVHFQKAIDFDFNTVAAHLFLGLIDFNDGNINSAANHFSFVKNAQNPELKTIGHYYTGLIHYKNGYGSGGTHEMIAARSSAEEASESKMAQEIKNAAEKILAPFDKAQWFASATVLGQYDSNITLSPSVGSEGNAASNKSTPNLLINGGLGRMSSPTSPFQWVGSFRFNLNRTLNAETKTYDFLSNIPSLYLNYYPLSRTNGGIKVDAHLTFQRQPIENNDESTLYRIYSLQSEPGLFIKHEVSQSLQVQLDLSTKINRNDSDSGQSGNTFSGKISLRSTTNSRWITPSGSLGTEINKAKANNSQSNSFLFDFVNQMRISSADTVTLNVNTSFVNYPLHSLGRKDTFMMGRLSWIHSFSPHWSVLADMSYSSNASSLVESYTYTRYLASFGVGWSL